jgi:AcrR family transcriptional regulator
LTGQVNSASLAARANDTKDFMPRWKNDVQTDDQIQRIKRAAVIKQAGLAFSKRGYHNTSLDEVAKMLQVSKGTLYNYVKDKQEILFECHEMALDIGDRAFNFSKEHQGTGAQVLEATLCRYIEMLTEELGACGVLMEVDALRPEDRESVAKRRSAFEKNFVTIIQRGIQDGSMRSVDPKLAVFTFMGAINWMPRWFTPEGRLSGAQVARQMTDLLLIGLVTPDGARKVAATFAAQAKGRSKASG